MPLRIQRCQPYHRGSKPPSEVTHTRAVALQWLQLFAAIATPPPDSSHTQETSQSGDTDPLPQPQPPTRPHGRQGGPADALQPSPWGQGRGRAWHVSAVSSSSGVDRIHGFSAELSGRQCAQSCPGPGPEGPESDGGHSRVRSPYPWLRGAMWPRVSC